MSAILSRLRWQRPNKSWFDHPDVNAPVDEEDGDCRVYDATIEKLQKNSTGRPLSSSLARCLALQHVFKQLAKIKESARVEPECNSRPPPPRKTRYMTMLLSTPANEIQNNRHPVIEASKYCRTPFASTVCFTRVSLEDKKREDKKRHLAAALMRRKGNAPTAILETLVTPPQVDSCLRSQYPKPGRPSTAPAPPPPTINSYPKRPTQPFSSRNPLVSFPKNHYTVSTSHSDPLLRTQNCNHNANIQDCSVKNYRLADDEDDEVPLGLLRHRSLRKARSVSEVQTLSA